jgi:hypothetical protein
MKQQLLVLFFLIGLTPVLYGQDAIYTVNKNHIDDVQLLSVTDDDLFFKTSTFTKSLKRSNILFVFKKNGNFLITSELSSDLTTAEQQLQSFISSPPRKDGKDYLIKVLPLTVIPAEIVYESTSVINYRLEDGKSASMPKDELVAILRRNGDHSILRDYAETAPLLAEVQDKLIPRKKIPEPQPEKEVSKILDEPRNILQPKYTDSVSVSSYTSSAENKMALSVDELASYSKKAIKQVNQFVKYLNVITDKSQTLAVRNRAIENAIDLFMPGAQMEVTSKNRLGSRRYPIAEYLNRLKLLPYESTQIEWTNVAYLKELSQAADGNYYGIITGEQRFIGYGSRIQYEDVVDKNVRVKLKRNVVIRDANEEVKWTLLLGSIGISTN